MSIFSVTIFSKHKASIKHFILFYKIYLAYNLNSINTHLQNQTKIKTIMLLKSPHVNKKSQQQFETKDFKQIFKIKSENTFKFLLFLKKVDSSIYSNINLKVEQFLNKNFYLKNHLNTLNLNIFELKTFINSTNKIKNFKLKKSLDFKKTNIMLNFLLLVKIKKLFFALELYGDLFRNV